ncbi:MAG TPA: hypothetical protein VFH67_05385, partial [bacterium]|nr:hypothetical protein [bacterium]
MLQFAWVIPVLPFIGFWWIIFAGRRAPGQGAYVAIGAMSGAALLSVAAFIEVARGARYDASLVWATLFDRPIEVGYQVDPLTSV